MHERRAQAVQRRELASIASHMLLGDNGTNLWRWKDGELELARLGVVLHEALQQQGGEARPRAAAVRPEQEEALAGQEQAQPSLATSTVHQSIIPQVSLHKSLHSLSVGQPSAHQS